MDFYDWHHDRPDAPNRSISAVPRSTCILDQPVKAKASVLSIADIATECYGEDNTGYCGDFAELAEVASFEGCQHFHVGGDAARVHCRDSFVSPAALPMADIAKECYGEDNTRYWGDFAELAEFASFEGCQHVSVGEDGTRVPCH